MLEVSPSEIDEPHDFGRGIETDQAGRPLQGRRNHRASGLVAAGPGEDQDVAGTVIAVIAEQWGLAAELGLQVWTVGLPDDDAAPFEPLFGRSDREPVAFRTR